VTRSRARGRKALEMPSVDEITSPEPRLSGLRDREPLVGHESGESSDDAGGGSERRCHNDDAASRARTLSGLSLVSILYFSVVRACRGCCKSGIFPRTKACTVANPHTSTQRGFTSSHLQLADLTLPTLPGGRSRGNGDDGPDGGSIGDVGGYMPSRRGVCGPRESPPHRSRGSPQPVDLLFVPGFGSGG
jgi:hypothetical protein